MYTHLPKAVLKPALKRREKLSLDERFQSLVQFDGVVGPIVRRVSLTEMKFPVIRTVELETLLSARQ
jgi:hypothetical protein